MVKNGLFLISIGLLVFMVGAVGPSMHIQNIPLLILALILLIGGVLMFLVGHRRFKESQKDEVKDGENK